MYFKKSVYIPENVEVLTNPDNQLTVGNKITRQGKRYINLRTIINYIMSFFR